LGHRHTRFWIVPVETIDYTHDIDMQQLFAQLAVKFKDGDQWWLTPTEEAWLDEENKKHRSVSALREQILDKLDRSASACPASRRRRVRIPAMGDSRSNVIADSVPS